MSDDYDRFTERMTSFDLTLSPEGEPAKHSEGSVDDILAHYGVKGMKWGVRKDRSGSSQGPLAKRKAKRAEAKAQKQADRAKPDSEDATNANQIKRTAKNAGLSKLSNQELEAAIKRMRLEQQLIELSSPTKKEGKSFLETYLDEELKALNSGKAGPTDTTIETVRGVKKVLDKLP